MPKDPSPKKKTVSRDDIVLAAMDLAAARGWAQTGMRDVAQKAGVSLAEIYDFFEDKSDILCAFGRMIDRETLTHAGSPDESMPVRDRLFDLLMERFDALNAHRAGAVSILRSFRPDPKQAVISCPHLCRSMARVLDAAGENTGGLSGAVKVAGLTALYLSVLRVWVADDSPDMSKVMAALDKALGRAEKLARSVAGRVAP